MDFTQDDLFDAIDRAVREALDQARVTELPVDAVALAQDQFGLRVEYVEEEDEPREYGAPPKRRFGRDTIVLKSEQSEEAHQVLAARGVAMRLLPRVFDILGFVPGAENRAAEKQLIGLIVPRLLLPTRWFAREARQAGFDLFALKEKFPTHGHDLMAWRFLDIDDEASVVTVVDDGNVVARRGNRFAVTKKLTDAEQACLEAVIGTDEPARVRRDDWTAWGWPTKGIPFRRIILRAVPDGI